MSLPKADFSNDAALDLADILEHISRDNPDAAERVVLSILEKASELATTPHMGRARPDLLSGVRSYATGTYVVFYEITLGGIGVLRVLHGARDAKTVLRRNR